MCVERGEGSRPAVSGLVSVFVIEWLRSWAVGKREDRKEGEL